MIRRITSAYRKIPLALLLLSFLGAGYSAYAERLHLIPYSTWAEDDSEYEASFRFGSLERCTFSQGGLEPGKGVVGFERLWVDRGTPRPPEVRETLHHLRYGQITALLLRRGPPAILPPGLS